MTNYEIAKAEFNETVELEKRLAESGETMTVYEEDRIALRHILDFVQDNFGLYVNYIEKERS